MPRSSSRFPATPETPPETPPEGQEGTQDGLTAEERKTRLRAAYGAATTRLREQFKAEFDAFYEAAAAERGVEWHPRLSPEQRAEQEFDSLMEQFPHLRERLSSVD